MQESLKDALLYVYLGSWAASVTCAFLAKSRMKKKCPEFHEQVYRKDLSVFAPSYGWSVIKKTFLLWRTFRLCPDPLYAVFASITFISGLIVYTMSLGVLLGAIIIAFSGH